MTDYKVHSFKFTELEEATLKKLSELLDTTESNVIKTALANLAKAHEIPLADGVFALRKIGNTTRGENRRGSPKKECVPIN
jgi:hypothetical protein